MTDRLTLTLLGLHLALRDAARGAAVRLKTDGADREAGDVPGWVLVTVMSAALIVVIIAVAGPVLSGAFSDSVNNVKNTPGSSTKG